MTLSLDAAQNSRRSIPAAAAFDAAGLRRLLLSRRNADGGWAYAPGKSSRLEPTCWALLALGEPNGPVEDLDVLRRWQRHDEWLVDVGGAPINFTFNALAALTMLMSPAGVPAANRIATRLLDVRGLRFDQGKEIRQDNSLQAWPWIESTFSWVEPTSLCLLLMKKLRPALPAAAVADRIDIAERMLRDRACTVGGWNYGGSNVYGQELFPYVPTTALGLLALQDHHDDPIVVRARTWLQKEAASEPSAQSLALTRVALRIHRTSTPEIGQLLAGALAGIGEHSNTAGLAAGLFAMTRLTDGKTVFAL
jgi:hypothetical protein